MATRLRQRTTDDLRWFFQEATLGLRGIDHVAMSAANHAGEHDISERARAEVGRFNRVKYTLDLLERRHRRVLRAAYELRNRSVSRTSEARTRAANNAYVQGRLREILKVVASRNASGRYSAEDEVTYREQEGVALELVRALEHEHAMRKHGEEALVFVDARRAVGRIQTRLQETEQRSKDALELAHKAFEAHRDDVAKAFAEEKERRRSVRSERLERERRRPAPASVRELSPLPDEKGARIREVAEELASVGVGPAEEAWVRSMGL